MIEELKRSYASEFDLVLLNDIAATATYMKIPAGEIVIDIHQYVRSMPLLISGVIKVLREDSDGDELLLYYLEKGDTCSMTMTCALGETRSEIRAITETDCTLFLIPMEKMEEYAAQYKSWRAFVMKSYHTRLTELLHTLDSVAFEQLDTRLLHYLQEKVRITQNSTLSVTHQQIAYDLHSSRVVISRLLKKMEKLGYVELHRNTLRVLKMS